MDQSIDSTASSIVEHARTESSGDRVIDAQEVKSLTENSGHQAAVAMWCDALPISVPSVMQHR